jgi:hypothetical protein
VDDYYYQSEDIDEDEMAEPAEPEPERERIDRSLNRAVHVDTLLENWRTQIRKAGVESEELYIKAVHDIFATESEREASIAENMLMELEDVVETQIASLENTIMYLANKGRAQGKDDPRITELNEKVKTSGKVIRDRAVEIR